MQLRRAVRGRSGEVANGRLVALNIVKCEFGWRMDFKRFGLTVRLACRQSTTHSKW